MKLAQVVNKRTVDLASEKTPIHCQTLSGDPISCYGNSVERTNEIVYRIFYEFLLSRTTESDSGAGR